jgi:PAS domain S-box-containing protein
MPTSTIILMSNATSSIDRHSKNDAPPLWRSGNRSSAILRRENIIALGNSGTGKTHIALALGLAACQKGFTVAFTTAAALVSQLLEARDERRLLKMQRDLAAVKLLIIDELGYGPLSPTGAELLFEVFSQRYERGSTIVTSNPAVRRLDPGAGQRAAHRRAARPAHPPRQHPDDERRQLAVHGQRRTTIKTSFLIISRHAFSIDLEVQLQTKFNNKRNSTKTATKIRSRDPTAACTSKSCDSPDSAQSASFLPAVEISRLAALHEYGVLDSPPEDRFDRIVALAAAHFKAPIALISLIDEERQWFKTCVGLTVSETPREVAFCDCAIQSGPNSVLIVENALDDARFCNNPLVLGAPFVRFYAGAVLTTADGYNLGTLCIIDTKLRPRPSDDDMQYLRSLANLVVDQLEFSKALRIIDQKNRLLKNAEALSGLGHWSFNTITREVTWSDEVFRIHGLSLSEIAPKYEAIQLLYHEDDRATLTRLVDRAVETGEGYEFQLRIRRPDGCIRHTVAKAECIPDNSGKTTSIFGVFQDITEQFVASTAVAESEKHYRLLADNVSDVIAVYGADGIFRYASPSISRLLGYAPDELVGQTAFVIIHEDDHERVAREFSLATKARTDATVEYRVLCKSGEVKWVEAKPRFHCDASGALMEITDSVRDVTERRVREATLLEARLNAEKAATAKASFLANMSHEIRTPMNGVIGFTELLLSGELAEEQRRHVQLIAESGRAMMRLLNDILDMSKIDSGQMCIAAEAIDLRQMVRSAASMLQPAARAKDLDILVRIDPKVPAYIESDEFRLRQIVLNLLGNAAKFTERGWIEVHVTVDETAESRTLRIEIRDSGIGIPAEQLGLIFQKFAQADSTVARRFGGTGLGLPISAELLRLMGGTIVVESELGKGSTFTVRLPLISTAKVERSKIAAIETVAPSAFGQRPRVLIAEDHDINQILITEMAIRAGMDPIIATNGAVAIEMVCAAAAEENPFALVLMDMQMPEMDGLEATRQLRASGYDATMLPIVALTASAYAEDISACLAAGMQAHLSKPVRLRDLQDILAKFDMTSIKTPQTDMQSVPNESLEDKFAQRHRDLLDRIAKVIREGKVDATVFDEIMTMLHQFAGVAALFGQGVQGSAAAALEMDIRAAGRAAAPALLNERWKVLDVAA